MMRSCAYVFPSRETYFKYAEKVHSICQKNNVKLLLNCSLANYEKYAAGEFSQGIHLTSKEIKLFSREALNNNLLISTSTHNEEELLFAENKGVDFMVLSPVNKTLTHPDTQPLGWENFRTLVEKSKKPIFALGGMEEMDLIKAKNMGAQGISAISLFWNIE